MALFLFHFFLNCAGIIGFQLHAAQNVFAAQQVCTGFHLHLNYALKQHEEELERQNAKLRRQLADRTLRLEQVGSIAEAALSLNRVFEAAQAAADQYLESVKAQYPVQGTEFSPTANNEGAYWK